MALAIEEKYDQVKQLIVMGKERGYLLYDEVNDILPAEVHSSEEIDDLLSTFERYGIDIYEDAAAAKAARATADPAAAEAPQVESKDDLPVADEPDLDLTPGMLEKTNDPVRMYLREMGTVPLLNREGEVAIAKRIERGQLLVLKTITRSPIILKELLTVGEDLRKGTRSIKEIVQFDDEELTDEKIENKTKKTLKVLDQIAKLYLNCLKEAAKLERMTKSKKLPYLHQRYRVARMRIEMSQLARSLEYHLFEKKRLIEKIRQTVERLQSLEREAGKLERRADVAKGDNAAEARKELQKAIDHAGPETMAQALRSMAISYAFEGNAGQVAKYEKQVFDDRTAHTEWLAAATVCNELARMYLEMGDSNNAYKWYKKGYDTMLRTKDMSDADKNLWLFRWESAQARVASRRGNAAEAQQHVTAAKAALDKANNPEQAQFYPYIVGYVAFYSGDYKTAIEQLQKASQEDALNLAMLAQSYEKSGDNVKAKEYYQKTLNVNTHNPTNAFARPLARKKLASES